ncbi:antichymotrypsin-2-like [Anopheles marshallii]|uniref:antichymotrypsin-2-like n=1 Tax=Anopheles marshallii TaxID=1521116 RepID=UPI00237A7FC4|nr:antichymotrypsin-2-like [Anopheles marshallii]
MTCFTQAQNIPSVAQNPNYALYPQYYAQVQTVPHLNLPEHDPPISFPTEYNFKYDEFVQPQPQTSGAMRFAWRMLQTMILPQQGNAVMCPILPQTLLASLDDAADDGAKTELRSSLLASSKELGKLVRNQISDTQQSGVNKLDQAMAIFLGTGTKISQPIQENALKDGVEFLRVNFMNRNDAAATANNWVSQKSRGNIREIVAPNALDASTRLMLASVIYFKGKWKNQFTKTEPGLFETAPSFDKSSAPTTRQVPMMYMFNKLRYGEVDFQDGNGMRWVELPYEGSAGLSMILMLPKVRHQLQRSVDQLKVTDVAEIISGLKQMRSAYKMHLYVPKFNLYSSLSLVQALKNLGLKSIFDRPSALSGLADEPLVVRDVSQRTFIAIDEQGTTATSAAALSFVALSAAPPPPTINFTVNEPFLLMIVDKTNQYPLFVGKIVNPESN